MRVLDLIVARWINRWFLTLAIVEFFLDRSRTLGWIGFAIFLRWRLKLKADLAVCSDLKSHSYLQKFRFQRFQFEVFLRFFLPVLALILLAIF